MRTLTSLLVLLLLPTISTSVEPGTQWSGFRGSGDSISQANNLPLRWSDDTNIAWQVDLEGYGQSSPIIWGEHVVVTSALGSEKQTMRVDSYQVSDGALSWSYSLDASQQVEKSKYVSCAAPTPVTDGERVYAFFESGDVVALSLSDGEKIWHRSLTEEYGEIQGSHGLGSSPTLTASGLVILVDHDGPSYLICLDPMTGENRWKVDREPRVSWSSPITSANDSTERIYISSNGIAEVYHAQTGELLWHLDGIEKNTVASPTIAGDLMIIGSSEKTQSRALHTDPKTGQRQVWNTADATSSFGSPLAYDDCVYFVNRSGVVFCNDLITGKQLWNHRLTASTWASPIAAHDRIYFFSNNGITTVLEANVEKAIPLATNELTCESKVYGVAATDGHFILRMESKLFCIGAP